MAHGIRRSGVFSTLVVLAVAPLSAWSWQQAPLGTWRRTPATTDRMTERVEEAARRLQSEAPLARTALSDIAYPGNQDEYGGLDGNAVMLITAIAQDRAALPVARVSVVAGDRSIDLTRIYSVLSDQTGSGKESVKTFGPYREDVLCLLPFRLRMQPGDVVVEFGGGRGKLKATSFGASVPPQISRVVAAYTLGNGPSEQRLDAFIRREFPGVLDPPCAKRTSPASGNELSEITARGRQLARYDQAAWHATDAARALGPAPGSTECYVAVEDGGKWVVAFGKLDETRSKLQVVYEAVQGTGPADFSAKKLDPPREETGSVLFRARAIETTRADFGPRDRPYNVAIVPASKGQVFVYFVPAQTDAGIFPLGGDTRYLVSRDGTTILERRELHRATIDFKAPGSGNTEAPFHTAVLDDAPEDTDVFHVLARTPSIPELILTPQYVYRVEADGTICYVTTTDAFMKVLNHRGN